MTGKQLKNSILQWAIQGKLVPQDPNDEPASVLLEKIRAEKARLIQEGKIKKDKKESIIYRGEDNSYYEKFTDGKEVCIDDEIPFEIPTGWEWCRIRDISQSYIGLTYKPTDVTQTGTIVLRSSNIQEGQLDLNDIVRVSTPIPDKLWVEEYDIIICARNGSKKLVGKSAIVDNFKEPMTFGAFMAICKTPIFRYVYNFLQSELFYAQLRGVSGTTTINQLTQNNFNNFLIPIPPFGEQQRIDDKLQVIIPIANKYGESQEKLDALNNSLPHSFRKSILQEAIQGRIVPQNDSDEPASVLLQHIKEEKLRLVKEGKLKKKDVVDSVIYKGDDNKYYEQVGKEVVDITEDIPFKIPDSWEWCRMGAIGIWGAGSTPAKGNPNYYGGNVLWLRTGELNNSVVYDTEIKITQKALEECSLRMNKVGDVMIAMYGATIGKVAIAGKEMTTNQACCACTPIGVFNWFLFYFLMASQQYFIKIGEGGAQPNISREKLISYLIPIPPIAEQMRIVETLKTLLNKIKD